MFMTPLSLIAADYAIEEVHQVCNRLHYSTISTILLGKVLNDAKSDQTVEDDDNLTHGPTKESNTLTTKKSLIFKIDNIKIGLLQSSTNHETVFNQTHTGGLEIDYISGFRKNSNRTYRVDLQLRFLAIFLLY